MLKPRSMDLTEGSVFKKLLIFTVPIILSNMLQQCYSAADTIVVGQFANTADLAAVGSTATITGMLLTLFFSMGVGVTVICANLFGAKDRATLEKCMHTSITIALICGIFMAVVGGLLSRPILVLMHFPEDVVEQAAIYLIICFVGTPASLVYNFGSGILHANGNTRQPMMILTATGLINVVLNVMLVAVFHMGVAGVAIATVVSQYASAVAVWRILFDPKGEYRMKFRSLRIDPAELWKIVKIGIPCACTSLLTSLFNVYLQSIVNTFGSTFMAATTAFNSITNFAFQIFNAFGAATVSFAGQNFGAQKFNRVEKLMWVSLLTSSTATTLAAFLITVFAMPLLHLFSSDPAVVQLAFPILLLQSWGCIPCCTTNAALGCLRGMKKNTGPTTLTFILCVSIRIFWIFVIFPLNPTAFLLYICFPASYLAEAIGVLIYYLVCRKRVFAPAA